MRQKILNVLGGIVDSVIRAEDNPTLTTGDDKLSAVQVDIGIKLHKLQLMKGEAEADYDELLENIIQLIELVVWLFNFFGVFQHARKK